MSPVRAKFVCDMHTQSDAGQEPRPVPKASACPWQQAMISIQPPHALVFLGAVGAKKNMAKPGPTPKCHSAAYMIKATVLGKVAMPVTVSPSLP